MHFLLALLKKIRNLQMQHLTFFAITLCINVILLIVSKIFPRISIIYFVLLLQNACIVCTLNLHKLLDAEVFVMRPVLFLKSYFKLKRRTKNETMTSLKCANCRQKYTEFLEGERFPRETTCCRDVLRKIALVLDVPIFVRN